MTRKILKIFAYLCTTSAVALAAAVAYSVWRWGQPFQAPLPPLAADRSPEGVARGAAIFHSTCEVCHRRPSGQRVAGAEMTDAPAFLGTFYSANITSHPSAGVGARSDAELARAIRYGVSHDGRRLPMPTYAMGDSDVAALIGFMRSDDPMFFPDPSVPPPSRPSVLGRAVLILTGAAKVPEQPATGVKTPERKPTREYGEYLAKSVYDCVGCHSPGFSPDKGDGPAAFTGGFEFTDPSGKPVVSRNITPHATGIAHYRREDLARALRSGARPDGSVLSSPMPLFRGLGDTEIEALHSYLKSLPARPAAELGATPPRRAATTAAEGPAERFRSLGCVHCHGPGAHHEAVLAHAGEKDEQALAHWIRNPERTLPGTPMPTYAALLDEAGALELARWIKSGGPKRMGPAVR